MATAVNPSIESMDEPALSLPTVEPGSRAPLGLLKLVAEPPALLAHQEEMRNLVMDILTEGRDYGRIPGIDRPVLFKPGAERVTLSFGCFSRFRIVEVEADHDRPVQWRKRKREWDPEIRGKFTWSEEIGESIGLYRYVIECEIVHRETGLIIGSCLGVCSTMETRYVDRPREMENTIAKMAEKRAHVGAALNAFGLSEQFTQDVDENPEVFTDKVFPAKPVRAAAAKTEEPTCPRCNGAMWDNRADNDAREARGEKLRPDWKCRSRTCVGVYWRGQWPPQTVAPASAKVNTAAPAAKTRKSRSTHVDDDLPF
jgi:hypothetical protein